MRLVVVEDVTKGEDVTQEEVAMMEAEADVTDSKTKILDIVLLIQYQL